MNMISTKDGSFDTLELDRKDARAQSYRLAKVRPSRQVEK